ncbi:MAG: hypothetical protein AAGF35_13220 [Pseudomonadota bacterium]
MNLSATALKLATPIVLLFGLAACAQQSVQPANYCGLSATNNVDKLFMEASQKLQDPNCYHAFPEYKEELIAAASGAPGPENEARFAGLLRESIDSGIISKRQGQEIFSQYFDPEFYAVKSEARSSCTSLRRKDELYAAMRVELAYKREGMLDILDDESRFREAQRHYSDMHMVFDAVEVACMQES